jgi:hypothetical protein
MKSRTFVFLLLGLPLVCLGQENGSLSVKASTGRAGVFVDGRYYRSGRASRNRICPCHDHEVKLADPRYEELTTKVTIRASKKTTIHETLKELPFHVPVIYVYGRKLVRAFRSESAIRDEFSNFAQGLLLNPGEYTVKIVPASGRRPSKSKLTRPFS